MTGAVLLHPENIKQLMNFDSPNHLCSSAIRLNKNEVRIMNKRVPTWL